MSSWEKLLSPATEVTCWNSCCASSANIGPNLWSPRVVHLLPSSVAGQRWLLTSSFTPQTMKSSILATKSLETGLRDEIEQTEKYAPSIPGLDSCATLSNRWDDVQQLQNSTKGNFRQRSNKKSGGLKDKVITYSSVESVVAMSGTVGGPARGVRTSRKREWQDETAATESSMYDDTFSEAADSYAGTSTSQASTLEEQGPGVELPAVIAPPFSEDSILSTYTKNAFVDETQPEVDVGDTPRLRSFGIPISRRAAARRPKAASEREKQSVGESGRSKETGDDVATVSTQAADDEDLIWREIARGFVPSGADDFLAIRDGDRKAFHNFVYRRGHRLLIPKLDLNLRIAAITVGNSVGSASRLHVESPNASACGCPTGTEDLGSYRSQHTTSPRRRRARWKESPGPGDSRAVAELHADE